MKQVEEVEMKEKKQQKRKKKKGWDPLSLTVLLIALCVFVFSAYQLAMMMVPRYDHLQIGRASCRERVSSPV